MFELHASGAKYYNVLHDNREMEDNDLLVEAYETIISVSIRRNARKGYHQTVVYVPISIEEAIFEKMVSLGYTWEDRDIERTRYHLSRCQHIVKW